jgi:hypothetical protein
VRIATSLILIASGAILRYAVTARAEGIDLRIAGLILMLAGAAGLLITLALSDGGRSPRLPPPPDTL